MGPFPATAAFKLEIMPRKIQQDKTPHAGKYRLKKGAGDHRSNGLIYSAGEVIESDRNLAELYPNKFEVVEAAEGSEAAAPKKVSRTKTPYDTEDTIKHPPQATFELENQDVDDPNADDDDEEEPTEASAGKKSSGKKKKGRSTR